MDGDPIPDDEDDMIDQYFDYVLEAYDIAETSETEPVKPPA
jgi:hypothetical protein